jgi:hypothetical protein
VHTIWTAEPAHCKSRRRRQAYGAPTSTFLTGITYTGTVNPTPNVSFTWDPWFPRLASSAITSAYDELGRLSPGSARPARSPAAGEKDHGQTWPDHATASWLAGTSN